MPTFGDTGGETAITLLSIRSWTLCFRAQQFSVSCPRAFIWYAQRASRSYFFDSGLGWYSSDQVIIAKLFENLGQWFGKGIQVPQGPISILALIILGMVLRVLLARSGGSVLLLGQVIY